MAAAAAAPSPGVASVVTEEEQVPVATQELLLSAPGPHGHARFQDNITSNGLALEVRLTVPVPVGAAPPPGSVDHAEGTGKNTTHATAAAAGGESGGGQWPCVVHVSGFQCVASQYRPLAERLATHGYACVQYTLPRLGPVTRIVDDEQELGALGGVWAWAEGVARGALDAGRVAVAGHSRGGKLASLHYARQWTTARGGGGGGGGQAAAATEQHQSRRRRCPLGAPAAHKAATQPTPSDALPRLRALFLADPVDNTAALARRGSPSGVAALRAAVAAAAAAGGRASSSAPSCRPTFALACAGRFGGGNPMGSNWLEFLAVAPPRSRSLLLHNAGHATFLQLPPDGSAAARALDWAFGGGTAPRPAVMALTSGFLLAWLRREILGAGGAAAEAEEARWLAAVARAGAGAGAGVMAMAAKGPAVVQLSAEVKLGSGGGGGDDDDGAANQQQQQQQEKEKDEDVVAAQVVVPPRAATGGGKN